MITITGNPCPRHPELNGTRRTSGHCVKCERETNNERNANERKLNRQKVFDHYGRKCCLCPYSDMRALIIDHEDQEGTKQRRSSGKRLCGWQLYEWLVKNEFPEGYRTLCCNCNRIAYVEYAISRGLQ